MSHPTEYESAPFRGQWGGKIETGEEMWWSEPDRKLAAGSWWKRFRFRVDVRQYYLLKFLGQALKISARSGVTKPLVVDFGCGTGGTALNFSSVTGVPFHGYDIFPTQLEIARKMARSIGNSSRFDLLSKEGQFPLPDASIDVLFSADVLGHVPDIQAALREWARVMKPGSGLAIFTESNYSERDTSLMARLARQGIDLAGSVPEHISLFPRETLDRWFAEAGFEVRERVSVNAFHWFFFPKDYVTLLRNAKRKGALYRLSLVWNRISKLTPFYPMPFEAFRLLLTAVFGRRSYGTAYVYFLVRKT